MNHSSAVLVFATQHMPTGGIESHLQEFCRRLTDSGVTIDLVILNENMLPETKAFFHKICRSFYAGKQGKSYRRFVWLFFIKMKLAFRQYDALYTNGQGESIFPFARIFSRKKKWVHHHHTAGDAPDQLTWGRGYRKALSSADEIVACSNRNARDIESAVGRHVRTIPCFSKEFSGTAYLSSNSKLRFGYYGRLIPEKGVDAICRLSNDPDLDQIEFHIWGDGEAYPAVFFSEFPLIHFHGSFSGEQALFNVIGSIDAYLLISTHPEGLPIALLEVMSAGLPWIATDRGGISDIVSDPKATRILPSISYDTIKACIQELANDINHNEISKDSQKLLYAEKFSYKVLVKSWRLILGLPQ